MHKTALKNNSSTLRRDAAVPLSKNEHLLRWVDKMAELAKPAKIHWVDGSQEEIDFLLREMVRAGTIT
jgi:phosphoenolpyruvate carboxykinase (GTP)